MKKLIFAAIIILGFTACSSGSNDNNNESIVGLSLPTNITAISGSETNTNAQNTVQYLSNSILPAAFDDPDTDFSNDKTQSFVYDDSTDNIKLINYLLCFFNKLEYRSMVNKGAYIAAVNYGKCIEEIYANYNITVLNPIIKATVISSREDNSSPHIVKAWLPDSDGRTESTQSGLVAKQTLVEIVINKEASETNPFGDFLVNFANVEDASDHGGDQGDEFFRSYGTYIASLNSDDQPTFKLIDTPNPSSNDNNYYYYHRALNLVLDNSIEDSGTIHSQTKFELDDIMETSLVHYNTNRVLKGQYEANNSNIEIQQCFARDETRSNITSYNLYHKNDGVFRGNTVTSGQRVELSSSFSFDYNGVSGWMTEDYYWLDNDDTLPNGATITKLSYSGEEEETLNVVVSPGSFTRYQIETILLSSLQDTDLVHYGLHPTSGVYGSWILNLTANNDFVVVRQRVWTGSEYIESESYDDDEDVSTPEVPVDALFSLDNNSSIQFYRKLGFEYFDYIYDANVLPEDRSATFKSQDIVSSTNDYLFSQGATEVTLYCYETCPKGGLTQETITNAINYSEIYDNYYLFNSSPKTYTAKLEAYRITLVDDSNGLPVDASMLDLNNSSLNLGTIRSGFLVPQPLELPADYTQLSEAPLSYRWQTSDYWYYQSFVLLEENDTIYNIDSPIVIEYTYDATHDIYNTDPETNPYHGSTITLTYSRAGSLWGFPFVDDQSNGIYMEINLAAGTEMSNDEGTFVVKALWEIQYMLEKDNSECSTLNVETLINDPKMSLLTIDDIQSVSFTAADKPLVTDAPAVKPSTL